MAGKLNKVKDLSASSTSSVNFTDIFTDAYDMYKLVIKEAYGNTGGYLQIRFITDLGSTIATANYDYSYYLTFSGTGGGTVIDETNQTEIRGFSNQDTRSLTNDGGSFYYFFNPTSASSYTTAIGNASFWNSGNGLSGYHFNGGLKTNDVITGLNVFPNTGTIENFIATLYGVQV